MIHPNLNRISKSLSKQFIDDEENVTTLKPNPYDSLTNLRNRINVNKRLSQINKYYYNFHEFQQQAQAIGDTKQITVKDEELFNIKSYVEKRKLPQAIFDCVK